MAKRAEIAGQGLIILDATGVADRYGTNERLGDAGGRVLHRFGSRVLIGDVPARVARKATATAGVRSAHAGAVAKPPGRLTEVEAMGVAAWNLRMSAGYARAKEERPHDGLRWDAAPANGPVPPDGPGMTHVEDAPAGALGLTVPEDMSTYLIGSVAVGIIIVDGPTADLQFSDEERTKVVAEVQEGLTWMAHVDARAGVSYSYDIRNVQDRPRPRPDQERLRAARIALARPRDDQARVRREHARRVRVRQDDPPEPRDEVGLRRVLHEVPDRPFRLRPQAQACHAVQQRRLGPRQHRPGLHPRERPHLRLSRRVRVERLQLHDQVRLPARAEPQLPELRDAVRGLPHGRQHLRDVRLHTDPPRLARHRRRRRARPGRPGRQPEPGHRPRQDLLVRAVPVPADRAWRDRAGGRRRGCRGSCRARPARRGPTRSRSSCCARS